MSDDFKVVFNQDNTFKVNLGKDDFKVQLSGDDGFKIKLESDNSFNVKLEPDTFKVSLGAGASDFNPLLMNTKAQGNDADDAVMVERLIIGNMEDFDLITVDADAGVYELGRVLPFAYSLSGIPSDSSVLTAQPAFTVTASASSGTLTAVTAVTVNGNAVTFTSPSASFSANEFDAEATYTIRFVANGTNSVGTAATGVARSGSFSRYVPYFYALVDTAPEATETGVKAMTASTSSLSAGDSNTFTGDGSKRLYYAVDKSITGGDGITLTNGNFNATAVQQIGGDITFNDVAGDSHTFQIWDFGVVSKGSVTWRVLAL